MAGKGLEPQAEKMEQRACGRARHGEESGSKWRDLGVVQKVLELCAVPSGIEATEPLQARTQRHERVLNNVENNHKTWRRKGARQKRKRMEG